MEHRGRARWLALAILVGCAPGAGSDTGLGAQAWVSAEIPTVVTVRWSTDEPSLGRVEYGTDASYGMSTPESGPSDEHEVLLLGLTEDDEVHYRLVVDGVPGDDQVITTGSLPPHLPVLTLEGDAMAGYVVTSFAGASCGPVILAPDGQISWYTVDESGVHGCARARLSVDGQSMLYGIQDSLVGTIYRVALDGSWLEDLGADAFSHDFVEHADGTLAWLSHVERKGESGNEVVERIVERSPEGVEREVWNGFDHYDPEPMDEDDTSKLSWTHANALDYDADDDLYVLGLRNLSSVLAIDRQTGDTLWILGGDDATLALAEGATAPHEQHQFDLTGDGIVVFDNRTGTDDAPRVVEYAFVDGVAVQTWAHTPQPAVAAYALGDVIRLDGGNTLVDWSSAGRLEEVTPAGDLVWRLDAGLGTAFGYLTLLDDLYPSTSTDP